MYIQHTTIKITLYAYLGFHKMLIEDYDLFLISDVFTSFIQEALHREQMLENKLATLQRLVQQTQEASDSGWQVCTTGAFYISAHIYRWPLKTAFTVV